VITAFKADKAAPDTAFMSAKDKTTKTSYLD